VVPDYRKRSLDASAKITLTRYAKAGVHPQTKTTGSFDPAI